MIKIAFRRVVYRWSQCKRFYNLTIPKKVRKRQSFFSFFVQVTEVKTLFFSLETQKQDAHKEWSISCDMTTVFHIRQDLRNFIKKSKAMDYPQLSTSLFYKYSITLETWQVLVVPSLLLICHLFFICHLYVLILYMPFLLCRFLSYTKNRFGYDGKDFAKVRSNHLKTSMVLRFLDMALAISLPSYSILFFLYDKNCPRW